MGASQAWSRAAGKRVGGTRDGRSGAVAGRRAGGPAASQPPYQALGRRRQLSSRPPLGGGGRAPQEAAAATDQQSSKCSAACFSVSSLPADCSTRGERWARMGVWAAARRRLHARTTCARGSIASLFPASAGPAAAARTRLLHRPQAHCQPTPAPPQPARSVASQALAGRRPALTRLLHHPQAQAAGLQVRHRLRQEARRQHLVHNGAACEVKGGARLGSASQPASQPASTQATPHAHPGRGSRGGPPPSKQALHAFPSTGRRQKQPAGSHPGRGSSSGLPPGCPEPGRPAPPAGV